ncbi:MAG: hypothetical protein SFT90_02160 [Rickettsiales bacterium]|nr:hypothetical protein [Rickettsiales bacterium]
MEKYLKILEKIANGKTITDAEKTELVNYCEDKGLFNNTGFTTEEQKYNFLTTPFAGNITTDRNFLFPKQIIKALEDADSIKFLNENKILLEESNPMGLMYIFSCFTEEQKSTYNSLNPAQKGVFLGYLIASGNYYQPAGYDKYDKYQEQISSFLGKINSSDLKELNSESPEKLAFYGKEYFVHENILPKELKGEALSENAKLTAASFTDIDKNFLENVTKNILEKTTAVVPFSHDYNQDASALTLIFNDREFSEFGYDFNTSILKFSVANPKKVISNTYYPKEILEHQQERLVHTLNELMNYDFEKLTEKEKELLRDKSVDGKVNILEELRNFDNYTEVDADILSGIMLRSFKKASGIPDDFEVEIHHNNSIAEKNERGVFTPSYKPFFRPRKPAKIEYVSQCNTYTEDSQYPSTMNIMDRTFINTTPVLLHEMEHLYQEYLIQKLNKKKLDKDSAEYKYANLCLIAYEYDNNLQYFDKTYELSAFAFHEIAHDLLGYNFNDAFSPQKPLIEENFTRYDEVSDLDLTAKGYNLMLKEVKDKDATYAIFQDMLFSGLITPQDIKNLGIKTDNPNSMANYRYDKTQKKFIKDTTPSGRN